MNLYITSCSLILLFQSFETFLDRQTDIQTYRHTDIQTDIFFIAVLESWDAKMDVKKFLAQSEKKTDGTHYGIIRSEGSSDV